MLRRQQDVQDVFVRQSNHPRIELLAELRIGRHTESLCAEVIVCNTLSQGQIGQREQTNESCGNEVFHLVFVFIQFIQGTLCQKRSA